MLGLALVAGSVGLLATGAAVGFYAHYISTKSTNKKLYELNIANQMIETLNSLEQGDQNDPRYYLQRVKDCSDQLAEFRKANERNVALGYDPDDGQQEAGLMAQLDAQLDTLTAAVKKASATQTRHDTSPPPLRQEEKVREAHTNARRTAEHLRHALIDDIQAAGRSSEAAIRQSLWCDRKSTRLNSSHSQTSYAVFCLNNKNLTMISICRTCSILLSSPNQTLTSSF